MNLTTSIHYQGWPDDEPYPPTIMEVCQQTGFDPPVSEDDLFAFFAMCDERGIRTNIHNEPCYLNWKAMASQSDREYLTRLSADRVTAEWRTKSARKLDGGTSPITDSELFGGPAQGGLF